MSIRDKIIERRRQKIHPLEFAIRYDPSNISQALKYSDCEDIKQVLIKTNIAPDITSVYRHNGKLYMANGEFASPIISLRIPTRLERLHRYLEDLYSYY